jgi:uncharacterized protein
MRIIQPELKRARASSDRPDESASERSRAAGRLLTRRTFLGAAAGAGIAGAGMSAYAFGPAAANVRLSHLDALVPGLPAALDGLRVGLVTDVHLPANVPAARRALELLAAERPEVVVLGGDIVEHHQSIDQLVEFARQARGTMGTYAVMGNWERHGHISPDDARVAYEAAGVRFLCNESAMLKVGTARLGVVGLDDAVAGRPDVEKALGEGKGGDAMLWALHAPAYADLLPAGAPASLLLSGHTHGGQIRLPLLPAFTPPGSGRFVAGWYGTSSAPLYVSRGVGTTAIRARFNCPPELPILTLRTIARG